MGIRWFCDNCGNNETKENPVFKMTFILASVDPRTASTMLKRSAPQLADGRVGKSKVDVNDPKTNQLVESEAAWEEVDYAGPSAEVLHTGNQMLCNTCVKSIVNDLGSKFKKIRDHGTRSQYINPEDLKPSTLIVQSDGEVKTVAEVAKQKADVVKLGEAIKVAEESFRKNAEENKNKVEPIQVIEGPVAPIMNVGVPVELGENASAIKYSDAEKMAESYEEEVK